MPIPVAHEVNPQVPRALSAMIARCVAFDPGQRYPSFEALAAELLRAYDSLQGRPPISQDTHKLPPMFFTPSIQIEGETYSLISLGQYEEAARRCAAGNRPRPRLSFALDQQGEGSR